MVVDPVVELWLVVEGIVTVVGDVVGSELVVCGVVVDSVLKVTVEPVVVLSVPMSNEINHFIYLKNLSDNKLQYLSFRCLPYDIEMLDKNVG